jgi:hypothetical protein
MYVGRARSGSLAIILGGCVLAACGTSPSSPSSTTSSKAAVVSVQVSGLATLSTPGMQSSYQAVVALADGTRVDVTAQATWASSAPTQVTLGSTGVATFLAGTGPVDVLATYKGLQGSMTVNLGLEAEDCVPYDATTLRAAPLADGSFSIRTAGPAGSAYVWLTAATATDAANDMALMQRSAQLCSIGRTNSRPNRQAYIVTYWKGPTGAGSTIAPEDCQAYHAATLHVVSGGAAGWIVTDGTTQVLLLDSHDDATLAVSVIKAYTARCTIGRTNARPSPLDYTATYWK